MKKILSIPLFLGALAFVLTFLATKTFAGSHNSPSAPDREYLAQELFDNNNWQYTAYRENKAITTTFLSFGITSVLFRMHKSISKPAHSLQDLWLFRIGFNFGA